MATIYLTTFIEAPVQICFDLARNVEAPQLSTLKINNRPIAGRLSGLCEAGDIITWEASLFKIRQKLTVKITKMEPFLYFEDEMVKGPFSSMKFKHTFEVFQSGTKMIDELIFKAPFGILGSFAEKIFLNRYMTNFLKERNKMIKYTAEAM